MKKIVILFVIVAVLFSVYQGFIPKYKFKYYYSWDKRQTLTRITYPNTILNQNETYFTPGHYNNYELPNIYIKPIYSLDWDWVARVTFHSTGIIIETNAETKNTSDNFKYIKNWFVDYSDVRREDSLRRTLKAVEDTTIFWRDK